MLMPRLSRRSLLPCGFVAAAVVSSCNLHNEGVSQPDDALSFPIALGLSREDRPKYLYVANSNFNLRYNSGSLQVIDLTALDTALEENDCRTLDRDPALGTGEAGTLRVPDSTRYGALDAGALLDASLSGDAGSDAGSDGGATSGDIELSTDYAATSNYGNKRGALCDERDPPGYAKCCFDARPLTDGAGSELHDDRGQPIRRISPLIKSKFKIDSFAAGLAVGPAPDAAYQDRVYVPISSRSRITYLDVAADGSLHCGETPASGRCVRGPGSDRSEADADPHNDFPGQPSTMAIGKLADLGLTSGYESAGLTPQTTFLATAHERGGFGLFVEKDGAPTLMNALSGFVLRPTAVVVDARQKLLYGTYATEQYISRIGLRIDSTVVPNAKEPPREVLYESSHITLTGIAQPRDLRDIALDPNDPQRIFVLVRGTQESVAFLQIDPDAPGASEARLLDLVRVGAGPSKLLQITLDGRSFLLVACYDAKSIYILDTATRKLIGVVRNLTGPHEMVFDASRGLLHVADFRTSVLRVIDLKGLVDKREPPPRIVATLGSSRLEGGLD